MVVGDGRKGTNRRKSLAHGRGSGMQIMEVDHCRLIGPAAQGGTVQRGTLSRIQPIATFETAYVAQSSPEYITVAISRYHSLRRFWGKKSAQACVIAVLDSWERSVALSVRRANQNGRTISSGNPLLQRAL